MQVLVHVSTYRGSILGTGFLSHSHIDSQRFACFAGSLVFQCDLVLHLARGSLTPSDGKSQYY